MARLPSNASDKQTDAVNATHNVMGTVAVTTSPVVITAVQRKANTGDYETLDIYMAVAVPAPDLDLADKEALKQGLLEAADFGFAVVSRATADRYKYVKENLKPT